MYSSVHIGEKYVIISRIPCSLTGNILLDRFEPSTPICFWYSLQYRKRGGREIEKRERRGGCRTAGGNQEQQVGYLPPPSWEITHSKNIERIFTPV
jgi:hypothetical protein